MKIAAQIREKIKKLPETAAFGYAELGIAPAGFYTAAKALERLQKKGVIRRIGKGVFYKPGQTVFGELGPDYNSLLNKYLFKDNKRVGYVTGYSLYNQLALTTQLSAKTQVATNINKKKIEKGWLRASAVKAYAPITEKNYPLLGILDAIKDIKRIPDSSTGNAVKRLKSIIKELPKNQVSQMTGYALQYPPRARALTGAIVETVFTGKVSTAALKKSLNPLTVFKLGIKKTDLPTIENWNIQ